MSHSLLFSSSVDNFCAIAEQYNNLTNAQADALALQAQAGNQAAAEKLVLGHLHLVNLVVGKIHSRLNKSDLLHEGFLGLHDAIRGYDPTKGCFRNHAIQHIRYFIQKALAEYGYAVRISEEKLKHLQKVNRTISNYFQENGFNPSAEEVADLTGYKLKEVEELISYGECSLDENHNDDSDEFFNPFAHTLASDEEADALLCRREVADLVDLLTDKREAYIIRSFFGIDCPQKDPKTLAAEMHLTEQRIRQIKAEGIAKLRAHRESFVGCAA